MTEIPNRTRTKRPKRAPLRQLRRIVSFLSTFDLDEIGRFTEKFAKSQSEAAAERRQMNAILQNLSLEIASWKQEVFEHTKNQRLCCLNVKNLGYELGRVLAERDLRRTVTEP